MPRYKFNRITGKQLSKALDDVDLTLHQFCRLAGSHERRVERWLGDEDDIPPWVPVLLALLQLPGAMLMARRVAEHHLIEEINDDVD